MDNKKHKHKKFKLIKKTIAGLFATAIGLSSIPSIQCNIAHAKGKKDQIIVSVMESDEDIEEKIAQIFIYGIKSNTKLSDAYKEKIIESFCNYVIYPYGKYFTEDTILRMYAVASTQNVVGVCNFFQDHGWWGGNYNPWFNFYSAVDGEEADDGLIAHEQLHAIGRKSMVSNGFFRSIHGIGMDEAGTSFFSNRDYDVDIYFETLGFIIGFDNLFKYYFNADYSGLKEELNKYLTKEEVDELLSNMDKCIYHGYYLTFLRKNFDVSEEKENELYEYNLQRNKRIIELLIKMYEKKNNSEMNNDWLENFIFSNICYNCDIDIPYINYENISNYSIHFYEPGKLIINISTNIIELSSQWIIDENDLKSININQYIDKAINSAYIKLTNYFVNGELHSVHLSNEVIVKYVAWLNNYVQNEDNNEFDKEKIYSLIEQLNNYILNKTDDSIFIFNIGKTK